jgi:hypothetical protein
MCPFGTGKEPEGAVVGVEPRVPARHPQPWRGPGKFDSDFGSTPNLFTARIQGAVRQMVGVVNKDGVFYAFDTARIGGGPVWTTRVSNPANCPACGDGGFAPGTWDGHLLYEPGGKTTVNGAPCPAGLFALNPVNGAVVWSACYAGPTFAALTSGPGYLIIGAAPHLLVVSTQGASAGHVLYSFWDPRAPNTYFWGAPSLATACSSWAMPTGTSSCWGSDNHPSAPTRARYWIASARCGAPITSAPARSAIVRASLSTRWNARADPAQPARHKPSAGKEREEEEQNGAAGGVEDRGWQVPGGVCALDED